MDKKELQGHRWGNNSWFCTGCGMNKNYFKIAWKVPDCNNWKLKQKQTDSTTTYNQRLKSEVE